MRRGCCEVGDGHLSRWCFLVHDIVCVALCLCLEKKETCVVLLSGSSSYSYIIIHYYYQRGILGPQTAFGYLNLTLFTVSSPSRHSNE